MSVIINTRGTIHTSFTIGRTGLVLTQTGTAELPDGEDFTVSTSASRGLRVNAEGSAASITTDNSILDITAGELRFNGVSWPNLADGAGKILTTDGVGGIIWAEYVNSANSAAKLSNPRAITLTGDVTGAVTFDGTADVTLTTSLAKRVALGSETTGNFVSGLTAGTGITISGTPAAGWTPTIINSAPNVTTDISVTHNATNVVVQSSDGADGIINSATASLSGVMSAADKAKLDGISAGAGANQNAFSKVAVAGNTTISAGTVSDTLTIVAGDGLAVSTNSATKTLTITNTAVEPRVNLTGAGAVVVTGTYPNLTITGTDTTYSNATASVAGLLKLFSDDIQAVDANSISTADARTYGVQVDSSGRAVVNVPWTDGSTAFVSGNGISVDDKILSVTAGNGLIQESTGLALATPGTITGSTENAATATSHTHAITLTAADIGAVAANDDIPSGTGTKLTYDTKGLILSSAALDASDIPDLSADKITSGTFDTARFPDLSSKYVSVTQLGVAGGAATLDANGIIHSYQLPSYVDEVLEYANLAAFPGQGETGKIYVALDNNRIYRWSGSLYIEISPTVGNSDTATRLATARTISLSGDITGAATFDGSADISINATVAPNSVALGTDTTGNYVSSLTAGPGITISGTAGEGWTPIIINSAPNITTDISIKHNASTVVVQSSDGTAGIINAATSVLSGIMTSTDKAKLDGIAVGANNYVHPASGVAAGTYQSVTVNAQGHVTAGTNPTTLSGYGITDAAPLAHVGSRGDAHNIVTVSENGFMSSSDKAKLDGIAVGANNYVHPDSGVTAGTYRSVTVNAQGHVTAGTNPTTLSGYGITDAAPLAHVGARGDAHNIATASENGFMSSSDKAKLDGIAVGANNYVLPIATADLLGGVKAGTGLTIDTDGKIAVGYSGSLPQAAGVASAGIANTAARSDHVHPVQGSVTGNAGTATKLATARNISLTGDVTGSVSFDGSADAVITATISPNSVVLGTDTTGNYVTGLTAGSGIAITGTAGEGWTPTITNTSPNISTDISITHGVSNVTVNSSDGADGIINAATASLAGVMTAADKGKLDGIDAVISASTAVNIHAAAAKTTLADADEFGIADSAASWGLKKVTWANIKSSVSGNFYPKTGGDLSGDINITGTGRRITGDFSNSDTASRLLFRTNVANGASYVGVTPNGGATYSALHVYNSSAPSNSSTLAVIASAGAVTLASYAVGAGALLPLTIDIGYERARYTTSGGYSLGTTADPGAGSIYATGDITAYFSDERLKTVSGKISNALDKVKQLTGVYYTNNDVAKANGYTSDKTQVGVLAGEVERVLPEVVVPAPFDIDEHGHSKSGEHYRTVQYDKLVPLLIEAIKELSDIVESLKR